MAKGLVKHTYQKNMKRRKGTEFTRQQYSQLMYRFEHLYGGANTLTDKLINYFQKELIKQTSLGKQYNFFNVRVRKRSLIF